jgi:hypothetical protein
MSRTTYILFIVLLTIPCVSNAGTIDVMIKGVDDGIKTNKQQDYNEAVMNAKLQALERAGVEIQFIDQAAHFQIRFDMVDNKAKAVLIPGFQIMDIGYLEDGAYLIVLVGKVKTVSEEVPIKLRKQKENLKNPTHLGGRFVVYNNGIVLDTKTDLEWYCGPDKNISWYRAKVWVEGLRVADGGWQMPSINELKTLHTTGGYHLAPMQKITGQRVWSSQGDDFSTALFFDFTVGRHLRYDKSVVLTDGRVLAVRPRK